MPEETIVTPEKSRFPGLDAAAMPLIGVGLGLTGIALGLKPRLAAYPLALTAIAAFVFRDPRRTTPAEQNTLFAPADGTVTAIEELYEHRFLHTDAVRVQVAIAPFDVPVQRSPAAGVVRYVERVAGEARVLWDFSENERCEVLYLGIEAVWGPLLLVMYAGSLTPQIACDQAIGSPVAAGTRLATLRFGAQVDLVLPADVIDTLPTIGTRLRAGTTRIGQLKL